MLAAYIKDPYYLMNYQIKTGIIFSLLIGLSIYIDPWGLGPETKNWLLLLLPLLLNSVIGLFISGILMIWKLGSSYAIEVKSWHYLLIPLGIYMGMINVQLIHNCVHKSFRPRWLNRPLGELFAVHLLSGFPSFAILHLEHHKHSDHVELDPHPNNELTFAQYLFAIKGKLKSHFKRAYFKRWGDCANAKLVWQTNQALLPFGRVLRASVLFLLAGPIGFTFFLLGSFIANHLTFAHINYFTHVKKSDGQIEIVNLDQGRIYRYLNPMMLGGYSHKNHHEAPWLFNPSKLRKPIKTGNLS